MAYNTKRQSSQRYVRVWFKGGEYMDVLVEHAWEYESQPDWDHTEELTEVEGDKEN